MNETTICPACACNTLHSFEYSGHSLKCYDCYSCDYHKEEKVRHFDNQIMTDKWAGDLALFIKVESIKQIPVWCELKYGDEITSTIGLELQNGKEQLVIDSPVKWIDIKGINTPFYLVTDKGVK